MTKKRREHDQQTSRRDPAEAVPQAGSPDSSSQVEGEGSYSGTREYNERTRRFVRDRGNEIEPEGLTPEEEAEGEEAMREARERARSPEQDERDAEELAGRPPQERGGIEREQPEGRSGR